VSGRGETGRRSGLKIRFPLGVRVRVPPSAPLWAALLAGGFALSGCGMFGDDGPVRIAAIGPVRALPIPSTAPLGSPEALLIDATARGLVAHDSDGQIEAGLAERWNVIDNGRSYIFRLREAEWEGGRRVIASDVAWALERRMTAIDLPFALRGEFAAVESIRSMTPRVIEIRLTRPQPHFLDLLAHPAMAIRRRDAGWGPLRATRAGRSFLLAMAPDPAMAEAAEESEAAPAPIAMLWGGTATAALAQFDEGEVDSVLGGRFEHWPYLAAADINGDVIRRDPVDGLFGLAVVGDDGLLAQNLGRDAVAMAIDRAALVEALGVPEWAGRTTLRSPRLAPGQRPGMLPEPIYPAWIDMPLNERRARARDIVAALGGDRPVRLRIALPDGPGAAILFARLRRDLAAVNISSVRVPLRADADLRLIDEVAPSDDPLWYLRRVGCRRGMLCDAELEPLITAMAEAPDADARRSAVARADEELTRFGAYIPIAVPLRWSLAVPRLSGHRPNLRGQHSVIRLLPPAE
jgi:oligopeptide transport system substrate-binding protein